MWELMAIPHEDFVEKVGRDMYNVTRRVLWNGVRSHFPR